MSLSEVDVGEMGAQVVIGQLMAAWKDPKRDPERSVLSSLYAFPKWIMARAAAAALAVGFPDQLEAAADSIRVEWGSQKALDGSWVKATVWLKVPTAG